MTVTGPDFIALQVGDLERSAEFYENRLGLHRAPAAPPAAILFTTTPIPFAVREPLPGVDLTEVPRPGLGVADSGSIWVSLFLQFSSLPC